MSKIKVSQLKCFGQVADVIGKARAETELFKAVSVSKKYSGECISEAFVWARTPQGYQFWMDIYNGINPYDRKEKCYEL